MSESILPSRASSETELREQLQRLTDPHERSCQALGDVSAPNHNDGEKVHQRFGIEPLHKYIDRCYRQGKNIAEYPRAFIDPMIYTDDRDLELLDALTGRVEYDPDDFYPDHEALERYNPYRAKMMEWIAAEEYRVREVRAAKGTDMFVHGEPGGGKTTLALSTAMWRMQLNNETFIWAESVDESGTNERTEWLPLAPFATIAVPSKMDPEVRIVPYDTTVDGFTVSLEDIARDVITYDSVQDLVSQLLPGQFYVVFPDPLHRGCEDVSKFDYWNYQEVTPVGEEGPSSPTDADQWWFAFIAHRISGDQFIHPTFVNLDEAGNILDPDARKDIHQSYEKIKWFRDKYADARKKGVSIGYQAHALSEVHKFARQKIRWRVTMNGNSPPIGRTLPGDRTCPMEIDQTSDMSAGQAQMWKAPHWAQIKWPDMKRKAPSFDAEVSIDFRRWQEATGGGA